MAPAIARYDISAFTPVNEQAHAIFADLKKAGKFEAPLRGLVREYARHYLSYGEEAEEMKGYDFEEWDMCFSDRYAGGCVSGSPLPHEELFDEVIRLVCGIVLTEEMAEPAAEEITWEVPDRIQYGSESEVDFLLKLWGVNPHMFEALKACEVPVTDNDGEEEVECVAEHFMNWCTSTVLPTNLSVADTLTMLAVDLAISTIRHHASEKELPDSAFRVPLEPFSS